MASSSHSRKSDENPHAEPKLRTIKGGKTADESAIDELLSGKIPKGERKKRARKREVPPQPLPKALRLLCDLYASVRTLQKDLQFKGEYAEQRVKEYALKDFVHRQVQTEARPPSIDYTSDRSRFKFVVTSRTTLTSEKSESLRYLDIPIENYTEIRGLRVNYSAIKEHGLEEKLRSALASLGVSASVLQEVFEPAIELKERFYDQLPTIVKQSLKKGEDPEEKFLQIIQILNPTVQVRNMEVLDMDLDECWKFVEKTEITPDENVD